MLTVKDVRAAIEGLPDEAPINLRSRYTGCVLDDCDTNLTGLEQSRGSLVITVDVEDLADDDDDHDEFADDDDDDDEFDEDDMLDAEEDEPGTDPKTP
jgi:hypothetical protein